MKKNVTYMPFNHYTDNTGKKIFEDCVILDAAGREIGTLKLYTFYSKTGAAYQQLKAGKMITGTIILGGEND